MDDLLARLRLTKLAAANPYTLSGGEARRLSVATALATAPALLVLDEPTFGQDRRTWIELVDLLAKLRDDGCGVVAVTHDEDFVAALADRTVRLALRLSRSSTGRDAPLARRNPVAKLGAVLLVTLALLATLDPVTPSDGAGRRAGDGAPVRGRLRTLLGRAWPLLSGVLFTVLGLLLFAQRTGSHLVTIGPLELTTGTVDAAASVWPCGCSRWPCPAWSSSPPPTRPTWPTRWCRTPGRRPGSRSARWPRSG